MNLTFLYVYLISLKQIFKNLLLLSFHIILNLTFHSHFSHILHGLITKQFQIQTSFPSSYNPKKKMFHYIQKSSISQLNSTFLHINPFFLLLPLGHTQKFPSKNQRTEGKSVGSINRTRTSFPVTIESVESIGRGQHSGKFSARWNRAWLNAFSENPRRFNGTTGVTEGVTLLQVERSCSHHP